MGDDRPENNNNKTTGGTVRCWHADPIFFFVFSSCRVQISGSLDDYPVPTITVDTATDVSVVSHAWLMSHPTLRSVTIQLVPPAAVVYRASKGCR